ncbi:MAG: twin-arginine translocase TatA/TatE family subunit [Smithella sp.]
MFEGLLRPMHILVILGIVLIIFGPGKLSEIGSSLGKSIRGFKNAMKEPEDAIKNVADKVKSEIKNIDKK